MTNALLEPFRPNNTTGLTADYSVGFINSFRSHPINDYITATVALIAEASPGLTMSIETEHAPTGH